MVPLCYIVMVSVSNPGAAAAASETTGADPELEALLSELSPIISQERCAFAQRCRELSLSTGHLHLMALLDSHGSMSMTQLAEQLDVALPNASGLVERAHERGAVERVHDDGDRRVVMVRLTESGTALLRDLELIRRRRLALALREMTTTQRHQLLQSMHALRLAFERVNAIKENN